MRSGLLVMAALCASLCACRSKEAEQPRTAAPATRPPAAPDHDAALFSPLDLGFYEQPDREQWQKPDQIMDALGIADGSVVAEIGAGSGWFMIRLARRVGPGGHVYAEDIQPETLEVMRRRVQRENLRNVTTILGAADDPRLPRGLDVVLLASVYHEITDPVGLLSHLTQDMQPDGCIGIVDFIPGGGGPGPEPDQRADPETVIAGATAAGLQLLGRRPIPPFCYLLMFGTTPTARCAR